MRELKSGERVDIVNRNCHLVVRATRDSFLTSRTGLLVLPQTADGKLVTDFGILIASTREMRPGIRFDDTTGIHFELDALPAAVARLQLVLYTLGGADSGSSLADLDHVGFEFDGQMAYHTDMTGRREGALILAEIYRRNDAWRLSPNGQGFMGGIPMLAHALGIELSVPDSVARKDGPRSDRGSYDDPPPPGTSGGGSGFAVAPRLIVTNFHVIDHAVKIAVACESRQGDARVVATDPINDIALLALDHDAGAVVRFRGDGDIDLGEDIIVAGFPLQGLLGSGPQISAGNVSALTGMRNDSSQLQFNAPIGSGSSGGPILDGSGLMVGLVRAVLRTDLSHAPIAQNINFGVKASLVRSFLHAAGTSAVVTPAQVSRSRADIAREARAYLYKITVGY